MARLRKTPLRGSVSQQTPSVRLRPRQNNLHAILIRLGALTGSILLLFGTLIWLWHIGWPQRFAQHIVDAGFTLTEKAHFAVHNIEIEGRQQTSRDALSAAINTPAGSAILAFDPVAAAARIDKLPWVASVVVERRLPDTLFVKLTERVPLARWQHDNRTVVIDTTGKELPDAKPEQFVSLPLLVGAGALSQAKSFLETLQDYPAVASKMTAAVWVGLRRWDIYLPPKIVAKLPEGDLSGGLKRLSDLIGDQDILNRDIVSIDLRFPDRLIMEPATPLPTHTSGDHL